MKAYLRHLHIAPRKCRLVAGLIRGKSVPDATHALSYLTKRSALPMLKLLRSAVANASHNFQMDGKDLYIKELRVDEGPVQKRMRPRAMGRGAPIRHRTSHISLILGEK